MSSEDEYLLSGGVRIAIDAHKEVLFFEIQLCAYLQLLADRINSATVI